MAAAPAVVLAPLLLQDQDLVAALVLQDLGPDQGAPGWSRRRRRCRCPPPPSRCPRRPRAAGFAREALHGEYGVGRDAILLSAGPDHLRTCRHRLAGCCPPWACGPIQERPRRCQPEAPARIDARINDRARSTGRRWPVRRRAGRRADVVTTSSVRHPRKCMRPWASRPNMIAACRAARAQPQRPPDRYQAEDEAEIGESAHIERLEEGRRAEHGGRPHAPPEAHIGEQFGIGLRGFAEPLGTASRPARPPRRRLAPRRPAPTLPVPCRQAAPVVVPVVFRHALRRSTGRSIGTPRSGPQESLPAAGPLRMVARPAAEGCRSG